MAFGKTEDEGKQMSEQDEIFARKLKEGIEKYKHFPDKVFHEAEMVLKNIQHESPERIDILEKVLKDMLVIYVAMGDIYKVMFEAINNIFEKHGLALSPIIKIQKQMEEQFLNLLINSIPEDAQKN